MRRFEGRTAVITGAARGQGRSHAVRLASEGVVGLMRTFATWLAPHGIRVNCVNPSG